MKITKCITLTQDQDQKIRAIQMRRMGKTTKAVSYSSVLGDAIDEGLARIQ